MQTNVKYDDINGLIHLIDNALEDIVKDHIIVTVLPDSDKVKMIITTDPGYSIHLQKIAEYLDLPKKERTWISGKKEFIVTTPSVFGRN